MKMLQADWEKEYDCAGSYQTAIMRACEVADRQNLEKLSTIYPKIVSAYRKFAYGSNLRLCEKKERENGKKNI